MFNRLLKIMIVFTFLSVVHGAPDTQGAGTIALPITGQKSCYFEDQNVVGGTTTFFTNIDPTCVNGQSSGQDGKLSKGVVIPYPRFTDNENGTFTDSLTGLIWTVDATCFDVSKDWLNSLSDVNSLRGNNTPNPMCGFYDPIKKATVSELKDSSLPGDWRLPNRKELQSIIDKQNYAPALPYDPPFSKKPTDPNEPPFKQIKNDYYWTSSSDLQYPENAWVLDITDGALYNETKLNNSDNDFINYALPVRGGHFAGSTISVSPTLKDFGNIAVNVASSQTFTITNNSGSTSRLQVNAMELTGPEVIINLAAPGAIPVMFDQFKLDVDTCGSKTPIIAPGASCNVKVIFTPKSTNVKTANLRISGSDVNTPNLDIPLRGGVQLYTVGTSVVGNSAIVTCTSPVVSGVQSTCSVAPAAGYAISSVTGCDGTYVTNSTTYTTAAITQNCTVAVTTVKKDGSFYSETGGPSLTDALNVLQAYSGNITLSADEKLCYDVAPLLSGVPKGNGVIDLGDVLLILRRIAGIGTW